MPATKTEFTATEIKAGLLVLASVAILVGFLAVIRGCRPPEQGLVRYQASFTDIIGLNLRADVRFGGVRIGRVVAIVPDPTDRTRILVTAEVDGAIPVNRASVATIEQVSLTAEKHLEISTGEADAPLLASGERLLSHTGSGGLFELPDLAGLTARLEVLLDSVIVLVGGTPPGVAEGESPDAVDLGELMVTLQETLRDGSEAARGLSSLIADNRGTVAEVVARLAALEAAAEELLTEINAAVAENRPPLNATLLNLERLTAATGSRAEELAASLAAAVNHLEATGGNLDDLVDEERPALQEIIRNLRDTTANLKRLSQTLAERPEALIRGRSKSGREDGGP
ncbi:MAG: MlaD family protein [Thermoanaerobaculales bacterium]|jgi:phospholipid/cholesterol/gamma-HCH transport system substrate-binding protein|nr:MlaD family protein [Thermoanaerobaculales bacterium]